MEAGEHRFVVERAEEGMRLDRYLAGRLPSLSRSFIQKLTKGGRVLVDGRIARPSQSVRAGQAVTLTVAAVSPSTLVPEAIHLDILHEDSDLVVINKPAGMVVHPGAGARTGTIVHALLARGENWSTIGGEERPGIVHRLDRGTSGVMIAARNDRAHRHLSAQFKERTVEKIYVALVWGDVRSSRFKVDAPLGRDTVNRKKISSRTSHARPALTEFVVTARFEGFTLLDALPRTGRTHQIRAHLQGAGHPIVGDGTYGGDRWRSLGPSRLREALSKFHRLALHARRLSFDHPTSGERLSFEASLPIDFEHLVRELTPRAGA
jgi:23S rRNA pseudouridine1911/1915/1917 synthase